MRMTRRRLLWTATAAALVTASPGRAAATQVIGGFAFGSTWRGVIGVGADAGGAQAIAEGVIAAVDATMSPWRADSAISAFNRAQTRDWQPMDAQTCAVVAEAAAVHALTGGAFDATLGPAVGRFGLGPIRGDLVPGGTVAVADGHLRKSAPGVTLDLCGIAKGHALDRIVAGLAAAGIDAALIELGGEVRGLGRHPDDRAWQVAVELPGSNPLQAQRVVAPGALALATSGHSANGVSGRGALSHIIDPGTGRPVAQSLLSVSVLAPTAMRADALATALAALGATRGPALAQHLGISALFLAAGPDAPVETMTGSFAAHVTA